MKKMLSIITLLTVLGGNALNCTESTEFKGLVSIDSVNLMQRSKEGQKIAKEIQSQIETFQKSVQAKQQELISFQEEVLKQEKVLSPEALEAKGKKLVQMKKDAERKLSDSEENLKMEIQKQQALLRNKQMKVINETGKARGWSLIVEKGSPLIIFASDKIDATEIALKDVDKSYDQELASNLVAKNNSTRTPKSA